MSSLNRTCNKGVLLFISLLLSFVSLRAQEATTEEIRELYEKGRTLLEQTKYDTAELTELGEKLLGLKKW